MKKLIFITIMILMIPRLSVAEALAGNNMLLKCREAERLLNSPSNSAVDEEVTKCLWFTAGFTGASQVWGFLAKDKDSLPYCLPGSEISQEQYLRLFVQYLEKHPEQLHYDSVFLFAKALVEAFPCP